MCIPKRLRIYFEKLTPNEKVTLAGWGPRSVDGTVPIPEDPALSKRGIPKPKRVTRMTPVGSHAVIDPDTGDLTVILNPWKRHVEKTDAPERSGLRVHKGECIWLPKAKDGPGWYRIIEMSPTKQEVPGKTRGPKLKTEPAWLNVNELARVQKKKRDKWEVDLSASQVKKVFSDRQLRVKRDLADLPALVEEFASLLGSHGHRPRTEPGA